MARVRPPLSDHIVRVDREKTLTRLLLKQRMQYGEFSIGEQSYKHGFILLKYDDIEKKNFQSTVHADVTLNPQCNVHVLLHVHVNTSVGRLYQCEAIIHSQHDDINRSSVVSYTDTA